MHMDVMCVTSWWNHKLNYRMEAFLNFDSVDKHLRVGYLQHWKLDQPRADWAPSTVCVHVCECVCVCVILEVLLVNLATELTYIHRWVWDWFKGWFQSLWMIVAQFINFSKKTNKQTKKASAIFFLNVHCSGLGRKAIPWNAMLYLFYRTQLKDIKFGFNFLWCRKKNKTVGAQFCRNFVGIIIQQPV